MPTEFGGETHVLGVVRQRNVYIVLLRVVVASLAGPVGVILTRAGDYRAPHTINAQITGVKCKTSRLVTLHVPPSTIILWRSTTHNDQVSVWHMRKGSFLWEGVSQASLL